MFGGSGLQGLSGYGVVGAWGVPKSCSDQGLGFPGKIADRGGPLTRPPRLELQGSDGFRAVGFVLEVQGLLLALPVLMTVA